MLMSRSMLLMAGQACMHGMRARSGRRGSSVMPVLVSHGLCLATHYTVKNH
jgi:hypothetical protein